MVDIYNAASVCFTATFIKLPLLTERRLDFGERRVADRICCPSTPRHRHKNTVTEIEMYMMETQN